MLRKVRITDRVIPVLWGERSTRSSSTTKCERREEGGKASEAQPVLLGITKHRSKRELPERSVLPGHQRVLTEGHDVESGLFARFKENVIMATYSCGTGFDSIAR